ncbi:hypothetical protein MOC55_12030 [Bacillus spizizenii]|uniref:Uncharacterized protein n=1 Tax=Bacillus spizizenii TaxID=96241 RepID=A0A9Q4DL49_BACSC|nr:hypothetical protein [Bacillus spizizenii]MCY8155196.1 hypothetical protein [Bacillus spizizenii]MCY8313016.1 hypothetical protein [Bacillus spizizenii]MCY9333643.1 hypothetical protein [Bacillus spizizenii]MEC0582764.1 hypothetical protein [Bacillus spizizenii]
MGAWIKDETHLERRKFIDYIFGLIRYEIHKGEDNSKRLEVLSKIHHDLLYVEDLEQAAGWQRKQKGKSELDLALEKIYELTSKLSEASSLLSTLDNISSNMTKRQILDVIEEVKETHSINV